MVIWEVSMKYKYPEELEIIIKKEQENLEIRIKDAFLEGRMSGLEDARKIFNAEGKS